MKEFIKNILDKAGFHLTRKSNHLIQDNDPLLAVSRHIAGTKEYVFFDIGANNGQTIAKIRKYYKNSLIYSFEPNRSSFRLLKENIVDENVVISEFAMGAADGMLSFNEYSWSALSSFFKRTFSKSDILETYDVGVTTIDNFCQKHGIRKIHFLKTDTEGYELEVLKGAQQMMADNNIQFILVETFFNQNYEGQASFGDIYNKLLENNFGLVRFYEFECTGEGIANRSDALFINKKFNA